ncbi:MAG: YraN family protein [Candidatus Moranbacteria bacterium]|nr:YraN family protein [Candidatus Moranbacteria bacterium]
MPNLKSTVGQLGEEVAADFLKRNGLKIIEMNYKNRFGRRLGEIDIIAQDKNEFVFVEVKTRNFSTYQNTLPEENITRAKLHKLSKIANQYLYQNRLLDASYRFDAISVWLDNNKKMAKIKHIRNIFL